MKCGLAMSVCVLVALGGAAVAACGDDGDGDGAACPSGTSGCPCRTDGSCDTGSTCQSGICTRGGQMLLSITFTPSVDEPPRDSGRAPWDYLQLVPPGEGPTMNLIELIPTADMMYHFQNGTAVLSVDPTAFWAGLIPEDEVAAQLGMSWRTASRWADDMSKRRGFKRVTVAKPEPGSSGLTVHGPCGVGVEGLQLEQVAEL